MTKVVIVYHSTLGYTKRIAESIALGVEDYGAKALLVTADSDITQELENGDFDALIIGSPTYFGSVSAQVKAFMDSTSKLWLKQKWKDKVAGAFTCANSGSGDQLNTLNQIAIFCLQHGMLWVGSDLMPLLPRYNSLPEVYNKLGSWMGYTFRVKAEDGSESEFSEFDERCCMHFGRRIAMNAEKMKR